jgi:hypothetical protein
MTNPLVAERVDSTTGMSGVPLLESAADTGKAIASGDWASGVMGVAGVALDGVEMALDPFGAIFAAGVGWLIEHVKPLSDALDALTGDPDEITAHATTWQNVATEVGDVGAELTALVKAETGGWNGGAADSYRERAADTTNLIIAAQAAATGVSAGVSMAGEVVTAVRTLVRDIIAELVGHLVSWVLQVVFTLGIGLAWVLPEVTAAVAKTAGRIASITTKLVRALGKLSPMLTKLGGSFDDVAKAMRKLKLGDSNTPTPKPGTTTRSMDPPPGGNSPPTNQDSSPSQSSHSDPDPGPDGNDDATFRPTQAPPTVPFSEWNKAESVDGKTVYHVTQEGNVDNMFGEGNSIWPAMDPTGHVPPDRNRWDRGELGLGFYTHEDPSKAASYVENPEQNPLATLEFTAKPGLNGKVSPETGWVGSITDQDYRQDTDFIRKHTDNGEIKFHDGANQLELKKIKVWGMEFNSYAEYAAFKESMY